MAEPTDHDLLREFARSGTESAFATLVSRHINLVYSAARRFTSDDTLAGDITQAVFILLARKAGGISPRVVLTGWLYQTARLTAANALKEKIRRQKRESEASMQSTLTSAETDDAWKQLAPALDDAMGALRKTDRNAVLLRYFENKPLAEVGAALGVSEDAARVRVTRAVDKLRALLTRQGVTLGAAAIVATLGTNSVHAAPASLALKTSVIAAKGAAASASTLTLVKGALKLMVWTKAKTTIVAAAVVLLAGTASVAIYDYAASRPIVGIPKDWTVLSGDTDQWAWADGKINAWSTNGDAMLASNKKYHNVTVSVIAGTTNRDADIALRMQDANNGYFVLFVPDNTPWAADNGSFVALIKRVAGDETTLASFKRRRIPQSAKITVKASGPAIEIRLDDVPVINARDTTFDSGFVGLRICGDTVKPCDGTFARLAVY